MKGTSFLGLLLFFWSIGGFESPSLISADSGRAARSVTKAWLMTVMLFVVGATLLVWAEEVVDLIASELPPAGFRIIGCLLAFAGALWFTMFKQSVR